MIMTSVEASKKLSDLIKFYEFGRNELDPYEIPIVEVPLDRADINALKIAIKALGSLEPFSFIDLDGGDPDAH